MKYFFDKIKSFLMPKGKKKSSVSRIYINRAMRIKLNPIHQIKFESTTLHPIQYLAISNISSTGVAFLSDSFSPLPDKGFAIKGNLIIEDDSFEITLEVIHVSEFEVGCKFKSIAKQCIAKITKYFFYEFLATKLSPISTGHLKPDYDGDAVCFMGEDCCELYYVKKGSRLIKFNITILGNYVEVDKNKSIRMGSVVNDVVPVAGLRKHKGSILIQETRDSSPEVKDNVIRFLSNVRGVPDGHKNEMIDLVKKCI
jgi:hypothetical protein